VVKRYTLQVFEIATHPTNCFEESFMPHHHAQPFVLKTSTFAQNILQPGNDPWQVELKDPAISVMTDFRVRAMFTVRPDETIDEALNKMKIAGLRIAFVKEKSSENILGTITSYDIMGEKPMRYLQSVGFADRGVTHKDIRVSDIMEHSKDWIVADMKNVEQANVQNILEALQKCGKTHLPVLETGSETRMRGLFSSAKILRLTEVGRARPAKS
jgi:CBS domain-containing protein